MLQVSRLWTYKTGVPYISQEHWELQGTCCYIVTELEDDLENEDDGILNAFTAIVNLTERIVEDLDEE